MSARIVIAGTVFVPFVILEGISISTGTSLTRGGIGCFDAASLAAVVPFCCSCGMTRSLSICLMSSTVVLTGAADVVNVYCIIKTIRGRTNACILENIGVGCFGNGVP